MATCKDCLHFEVCDSGRHIGEYIESDSVYSQGVEKECVCFKNKAYYAEVKRGAWVKKPRISNEYKQCSICKYDFSRLEPDNYCPHCGAKMDLKEGATNG